MLRRFLLMLLILVCAGAAQAEAPLMPPELAPAVAQAQKIGQQLFDAFRLSEQLPAPLLARAIETAAATPIERCDVPYRALVIPSSADAAAPLYVYFIGTPKRSAGLMGGRHFRVEVTANGEEVLSVAASTRSCFFIPPLPDAKVTATRPVAAFMTHLLSPTPNEFHVFLSLLHHRPLYIGTSSGDWLVDGSKIAYLRGR